MKTVAIKLGSALIAYIILKQRAMKAYIFKDDSEKVQLLESLRDYNNIDINSFNAARITLNGDVHLIKEHNYFCLKFVGSLEEFLED